VVNQLLQPPLGRCDKKGVLMKKIGLILMIILLATSVSVFATDVKIGGAIGLSHSWMGGSDWDEMLKDMDGSNEFRVGFEIGAFFDIAVNELFSVQPELNFLYFRAGAGNSDFDVKATASVSSLEIPVLAKFKFEAGNGNFCFFFGPALQIVLSDPEMTVEIGGTKFDDASGSMPVDNSVLFAGVVGVGYELPMGDGALIFDLRYRRQFTGYDDDFNGRLNTIGLRVGYGFTVK